MFWERFYSLCLERGTRPNSIRGEFGLSSATMTHWKNGVVPEGKNLQAVADYFGVTVSYLLGYTDVRSPAPPGNEKSPPPEGEGDAARQLLRDAMDGLSVDELRQLRDYALFLRSRRNPPVP